MNQLFLEADGVCGDDDAAFALFRIFFVVAGFFFVFGGRFFALGCEDGGNEIGEAFADSGAGFGDQMFFGGDGLFDGLGHRQLFWSRFVARQSARDGARGSQYAGDIVYRFGHAGFRGGCGVCVCAVYCVRKCDGGTASSALIPVTASQFPAGSWIPERCCTYTACLSRRCSGFSVLESGR